ncbi:MAG TPA: 16S rRNA (cytosine(967)-C(5))-methyltransferase RsmB [Firmicutes bacterium]|nr:16S rRNA (cytosine(967)-C(5))-methyltransferase RsmB [Bacillota bacterium]
MTDKSPGEHDRHGHGRGHEKSEAAPARIAALKVLDAVEARDAFAGLTLDETLDHMDLQGPDRALATELVYGVLRWQGRLDWILQQFCHRPLAEIDHSVLNILRIGLYQILFSDKTPLHAAVHQAVELSKRIRGRSGNPAGFVNAVLRSVVRGLDGVKLPDPEGDPVRYLSVRFSHPEWLVRRWISQFGLDETMKLVEANNLPSPLSIRTNTLKISRDELMAALGEEGISCTPSRIVSEGIIIASLPTPVTKLKSFQKGFFVVQDEGSMLISHIVSPSHDDIVIDAASAPGTKTTHMAALMGNRGRIIAADVNKRRLALVAQNVKRLGITNVRTVASDARDLPNYYPGMASKVLLDAPCSGTGVFRRRPDSRWRKRPEQIKELAALQLEILSRVGECVRIGGILVYSTCSLEREENEDVIERFLKRHPRFCLTDLRDIIPREFVSSFPLQNPVFLRLFPHIHGTDGFFCARLLRQF